ncbi:MAG: hypothetical protein U9R53_06275 [Chloroflexota bacterium]|nr:hypothetical protein [Chloroflexota bacterium]
MKKISKILLTLTIVGSIALLTIPTGLVFAQEEAPPSERRGKARKQRLFKRDFTLDEMYEKMIDRYEDMGYRIQDTDDIVQRLENRIETLIEEEQDPAALQTILETFEDNMAVVEEAYADVSNLFEEHEGFDDEGDVLDEELAMITLRSIAEGLLDVHQLGEDARFGLRWDMMANNYQNRDE